MPRLVSLIYAKAVLQAYRLLFPDIVAGIDGREVERFAEGIFENLVTRFFEENFDFIPQEERATLELYVYDAGRNGVIRGEAKKILSEICGVSGDCLLSGRECISEYKAGVCEKKIDRCISQFLESKPMEARVVS